MSKRHYEAAAAIVRRYRNGAHHVERYVAKCMTDAFVELFKGDNPRFDERRFRAACNGSL